MYSYKRNIKTSQRIEYGLFQFFEHFFGRGRVNRVLGKRRRKLLSNIYNELEKSGEGKTIPIERKANLTLNEFTKNYMKKGVPVVLEGAAKDWDCVKNWSLEYFKGLHGTDEVVIRKDENKTDFEIITLNDIINNIQSGGNKYYRFYPLLRKHPEHIKDFDYQWLRSRKDKFTLLEEFKVAIGGKGTCTNLHNENRGNLNVQAYGEKKWILYPPYYTPIVDPHPVRNAYRSLPPHKEKKPFNPFNPDYSPPNYLYKFIDHYEVILKPGDILWVPTFYWHTVLNVTNSISVGYRWFNPFVPFKIAPLYMLLDFFATKPPMWKTLKLSKEDINLLLLAEVGNLKKYRKEQKERLAQKV